MYFKQNKAVFGLEIEKNDVFGTYWLINILKKVVIMHIFLKEFYVIFSMK